MNSQKSPRPFPSLFAGFHEEAGDYVHVCGGSILSSNIIITARVMLCCRYFLVSSYHLTLNIQKHFGPFNPLYHTIIITSF